MAADPDQSGDWSLGAVLTSVILRGTAAIGGIALGVMAFYILANVVMRTLIGTPLNATTEVTSRWLLVLLAYAGIVLALRKNEHISVGLLTEQVSGWPLRMARLGQQVATLVFLAFACFYGIVGAREAAESGEYGIDSGLPMWPARFFVPLFTALMIGIMLLGVIDKARRRPVVELKEGAAQGNTLAALLLVLSGMTAVVLAVAIFALDAPRTTVGWMVIGLAGALLMTGVYVGVAMGLAALLGLYALQGVTGISSTMARLPYEASASWALTVIPMFVIMGILLGRSGATTAMFDAAQRWLGWVPGGLAVTTNATGAALGAASGSTMAIAHALGRVSIPAMLEAGYPKRLAVSSVLMSGSTSQLIPPSILLVLYAGVAGTSVGAQLLSGIIPGLFLAALFGLMLIIMATWHERRTGVRMGRLASTWAERWVSLKDVWVVPTLILVIVGGIYFGIFTATEAGAIGAITALLITALRQGRSTPSAIVRSSSETVSAVGTIFLLLVGAALLSRFLAFSGVTLEMARWVEQLGLGRVELLLALIVVYLVMGMFMEPLSMMLLSVPVLVPVVELVGVDLIWFGVFVVLLGELAQVTPPVGLLLYVVHGLCRDPQVSGRHVVSTKDVMIASLFFVPGALLTAVALIFVPEVVHVFEPNVR